ncbi:MAG: hypothetical protein OXH14_13665 [Alphaproteobacteria bacterium]|nr:hypothetical protein [Alphaproteobacteria bacterium]
MTAKGKGKPKHPLPEPRDLPLPAKDFQPSKADMEEAYDMPGASMEAIRSAVFRPFNIRRDGSE